jgi:hypothetical protein
MSKAKLISNPAVIGIGYWQNIHFLAKHAVTDLKKNEFIDYMYMLSVEFPCGKCRTHIQQYIQENSFEPFMNIIDSEKGDIGMFKWAWMFHNAVNLRLHKPFVDFQTAWDMFDTGREVCTNCSNSMSQNNSTNASYEDSFEEKKNEKNSHLQVPKIVQNVNPKPRTYVDKKLIVQSYFLKKADK